MLDTRHERIHNSPAFTGAVVIDPLVSTSWLATHLADPDVLVLDASYHLPDAGRDAYAEYGAVHIPGAVFMDLARLRDSDNPLPSMMPKAGQFGPHMESLGLSDGTHVVLYDNAPHVTSARAWVVLRHFGIGRISILDGGMPKWRAEGRPLENGHAHRPSGKLRPGGERADIRSLAEIRANLETRAEQLVDARGVARFTGEDEETRPGLASGHIPGSLNLPYGKLFNPDGTWKQGQALKEAFVDAGVDLSRPIVATCGSGITASVLLFGLHLLGKEDTALYDGSWTEWGANPATPKAVGPA
jgi:thiosulfate/3-mercaptopyruvate sulfurtransferase